MKYFLPGDIGLFMAAGFLVLALGNFICDDWVMGCVGIGFIVLSFLYWYKNREEYFRKLNGGDKTNE